jgi:DNA replication protein DnaC
MLKHPTLDKLQRLKLTGMYSALQEQQSMDEMGSFSFEQRLGLLVDRELTERDNRRMRLRLSQAKLKQSACMEAIDFRHPRALDKSLITDLAECRWIKATHNILIFGPTGVGKTYLACALAHQACRKGYKTQYLRIPTLFQDLAIAKGDGRYLKRLNSLAKMDLLVLDDWGLSRLNDEQRKDLLEILEDRHGSRSTLVTSQVPLEHWHELIGDPTLADAILDRLIHNAYRITLKGESMRKKRSPLTQEK